MANSPTRFRVRRLARGASAVLAAMGLALAAGSAQASAAGQSVFTEQKCDTCHAVPAVGIEAKVKSAKMQGPDLPTGSLSQEIERLTRVVQQEEQTNGKKHPKKFTGSDEELAALFSWLSQLDAEPAPGASAE